MAAEQERERSRAEAEVLATAQALTGLEGRLRASQACQAAAEAAVADAQKAARQVPAQRAPAGWLSRPVPASASCSRHVVASAGCCALADGRLSSCGGSRLCMALGSGRRPAYTPPPA